MFVFLFWLIDTIFDITNLLGKSAKSIKKNDPQGFRG